MNLNTYCKNSLLAHITKTNQTETFIKNAQNHPVIPYLVNLPIDIILKDNNLSNLATKFIFKYLKLDKVKEYKENFLLDNSTSNQLELIKFEKFIKDPNVFNYFNYLNLLPELLTLIQISLNKPLTIINFDGSNEEKELNLIFNKIEKDPLITPTYLMFTNETLNILHLSIKEFYFKLKEFSTNIIKTNNKIDFLEILKIHSSILNSSSELNTSLNTLVKEIAKHTSTSQKEINKAIEELVNPTIKEIFVNLERDIHNDMFIHVHLFEKKNDIMTHLQKAYVFNIGNSEFLKLEGVYLNKLFKKNSYNFIKYEKAKELLKLILKSSMFSDAELKDNQFKLVYREQQLSEYGK